MEDFGVDSQFFSEFTQLYADGTSCATIARPTVRKYNRTKPIAWRKNRLYPVEGQVDLTLAECPQRRQGLPTPASNLHQSARDTRTILQNQTYPVDGPHDHILPALTSPDCPAKPKRHATSTSNSNGHTVKDTRQHCRIRLIQKVQLGKFCLMGHFPSADARLRHLQMNARLNQLPGQCINHCDRSLDQLIR